jgi:hypothetical protein
LESFLLDKKKFKKIKKNLKFFILLGLILRLDQVSRFSEPKSSLLIQNVEFVLARLSTLLFLRSKHKRISLKFFKKISKTPLESSKKTILFLRLSKKMRIQISTLISSKSPLKLTRSFRSLSMTKSSTT